MEGAAGDLTTVADTMAARAAASDEDRILRVWTPLLLRTILLVATVILVVGLVLMTTESPGNYVRRFQAAQAQQFVERVSLPKMARMALAGDPHSVMTLGLYALTLVPLARVAFCFLLFLKERDFAYVGFTAYVLIGLAAGILLGRIG